MGRWAWRANPASCVCVETLVAYTLNFTNHQLDTFDPALFVNELAIALVWLAALRPWLRPRPAGSARRRCSRFPPSTMRNDGYAC